MNRFQVRSHSVRVVAAVGLAMALGAVAFGQPSTWDGGGTTNDFTDALNWVGDVAPTTNGVYTFAGTVGLTPNNNLTLTGADNTLTFDATAGAFTLTGNAIRAGTVSNASTNLQTVAVSLRYNGTRGIDTGVGGIELTVAPLSTGGGRTLNKSGAADLTLSFTGTSTNIGYNATAGNIVTANASGTATLPSAVAIALGSELVLAQAGTANISGAISGAGLVRKTGVGPSSFTGLNTYTGGTVVEAGLLSLGADFIMAGANGFTMSGVPSPTAGSDYGAIVSSAGTLTYGGDLALTMTGSATAGASYDLFSFSGGTQAGSFANVVLGGSYTSTLTNSGGVWTGTDGGLSFSFTESTGQFAVSAVPEPTTLGLAGLASAAIAARWVRRRTAKPIA